jgi:choline dehydrogenase-like flavoprotein
VARELITRPAQTVNALRKRAQGQTGSFANVKVSLNVDLEQVPDPDSRLHLESSRDFLGLRKIVVDWRISPIERRTSAVFTRAICEWINESGLGKPQYSEDLDSTGGLTASQMLESYHHIGGTRMAADPATGVVDRDLKVFGIDNLYISGASVMPTGGHANPTLTILALSLRLANHLDDLF